MGGYEMMRNMKGLIRCAFDSHKWEVSKDGMENICGRCGIKFHDYAKRQRDYEEHWFRFLASLRRIKICNETWIRIGYFIVGICWGLIIMEWFK